ncbi:MAG: hypothetical protein AABZ74_15475 [Cyanobacteriota bacterium]
MKKLFIPLALVMFLISCNQNNNALSENNPSEVSILSKTNNNFKMSEVVFSKKDTNKLYTTLAVPKDLNDISPFPDTDNYVASFDFDGYSIKNIKYSVKGSSPISILNDSKVLFFIKDENNVRSINIMNPDFSSPELFAKLPSGNYSIDEITINKNQDSLLFSKYSNTGKIYEKELYNLNLKTKELKKIYSETSSILNFKPSFTIENKIVISAKNDTNIKNGNDILLLNLDGSNKKFIMQSEYNELDISFSPDGKKIAFTQEYICPQGTINIINNLSKISIDSYTNSKLSKFSSDSPHIIPPTPIGKICEPNDSTLNSNSSPIFLSNDKLLFNSKVGYPDLNNPNLNGKVIKTKLFISDIGFSERKILNDISSSDKFEFIDYKRNRIVFSSGSIFTINFDGTDKREIQIERPNSNK